MSGGHLFDGFVLEAGKVKAIADSFDRDMSRFEQQLRRNRQRRDESRQEISERQSTLRRDLVPGEVSIGWAAERVGLWVLHNWNRSEEARRCYMEHTALQILQLPPNLGLDPWPPKRLHANWVGLEVCFELLTPWYSKDDRPFHVLDNPVRKDRVFGVPFMAAASWKGMLRWSCRMHTGLRQHLEKAKRFDDWVDPDWILHLFGNEKGEEKHERLRQGALVFYPTWFDKISFEVINPHDRSRRAGTQPIYYEVVPGRRPKRKDANGYEEGGKGMLRLLYAPWPGMKNSPSQTEWLPKLLQAIDDLLSRYGISAKRTVGWGTAKVERWRAWRKDTADAEPIEADTRDELVKKLGLAAGGGS